MYQWIGDLWSTVGHDGELGPTLLVLGSVQTFCIDPLKEVFGVEEMAAGSDGGGGGSGRCYSGYSFQVKN